MKSSACRLVPGLVPTVIHIWCAERAPPGFDDRPTACHKLNAAVFTMQTGISVNLHVFCAEQILPYESEAYAAVSALAHNLIHKTCAEESPSTRSPDFIWRRPRCLKFAHKKIFLLNQGGREVLRRLRTILSTQSVQKLFVGDVDKFGCQQFGPVLPFFAGTGCHSRVASPVFCMR